MSIQQVKEKLYSKIEAADERLIRLMYALSLAYHIPNEDKNTKAYLENTSAHEGLKKLSKEELYEELRQANDGIENGKFTTLEDFLKDL